MNCKPGVLAYIVVPAEWPCKMLDGHVVEVVRFVPPRGPEPRWDHRPTWWCRFPTPWILNGNPVHECALLDSWLRPISGVRIENEVRDEVNE